MTKRRRSSSSDSSDDSSSSSSEDERVQAKNKQVDSTSSSEDDDEEWNERKTKKKQVTKARANTKGPAKKQSKPTIKESDESEEDEKEEGEVEDDDDEFNDGYDENLMGDDEDQQRLLQMTEKEREQELFNRSEKREVLKTRFEIEKKLRLAKKKEQNKNIPFTDTTLRSTDRRKALENNRKQKDGLKQLKEQIERRKQKAKLRTEDVYSSTSDESDNERNNRRRSPSSSSVSSSDDSSSDERRRKGSDDDDRPEIEEMPFELDTKTLNSIRLSRFKISQWCHNPFFKETVIGCFVRLSIGTDRDKRSIYRIAEIVDVIQGPQAYDLEKTKTDKLLKVKLVREEKNFRIQFVSNAEFSEPEFVEWKMKMERERLSLPNRKQIDEKSKHIQDAMNYNFKESDIEAIVREKEKFVKVPVNFAMKKTQLKKEKDMAEQRGDHAKVNELCEQLDELEQKAKEIDYKRTQNISAISYINERNRLRNIVESERAIIEAREQEKLMTGDDPFKRRKCAPMLVGMKKNKAIADLALSSDVTDSATNNNKSQSDGKFAIPNASSLSQKLSHSSINDSTSKTASAESEQNDLFSAHDFDIQIDFDMNSNLSNQSNTSTSNSLYNVNQSCSSIASNKSSNRRSLNLEEYKKKKGLI